ncbi:MAG: VOC family protein, partial [Terriglobia bacterium]
RRGINRRGGGDDGPYATGSSDFRATIHRRPLQSEIAIGGGVVSKVNPIPEGSHSLNPYICIADAAKAIEFYKQAFGAIEKLRLLRLMQPGGRVGHAELKIGDSRLMLSDEFPEIGVRSPHTIGGTPVSFVLYVEDVQAVFNRAVAAGAKVRRPIADQFYGDRVGGVEDPFGHVWWIHTHIEDVSDEELKRRLNTIGRLASRPCPD